MNSKHPLLSAVHYTAILDMSVCGGPALLLII